jgi:hypothetical protein
MVIESDHYPWVEISFGCLPFNNENIFWPLINDGNQLKLVNLFLGTCISWNFLQDNQ